MQQHSTPQVVDDDKVLLSVHKKSSNRIIIISTSNFNSIKCQQHHDLYVDNAIIAKMTMVTCQCTVNNSKIDASFSPTSLLSVVLIDIRYVITKNYHQHYHHHDSHHNPSSFITSFNHHDQTRSNNIFSTISSVVDHHHRRQKQQEKLLAGIIQCSYCNCCSIFWKASGIVLVLVIVQIIVPEMLLLYSFSYGRLFGCLSGCRQCLHSCCCCLFSYCIIFVVVVLTPMILLHCSYSYYSICNSTAPTITECFVGRLHFVIVVIVVYVAATLAILTNQQKKRKNDAANQAIAPVSDVLPNNNQNTNQPIIIINNNELNQRQLQHNPQANILKQQLPAMSFNTINNNNNYKLYDDKCSVPNTPTPFTNNSNPPNHHHHHHARHRQHRPSISSHRRILSFRFMLMFLILSTQILVASCMLDALKALFILTGASTYLGGDNNKQQLQQQIQQKLATGGGASMMSVMRPMYVLAIEEEEDERTMPKSLLNLSITAQTPQSNDLSNSIAQIKVDYILQPLLEQQQPTQQISQTLFQPHPHGDEATAIDKFFRLNRSSGELFLIRPLDRDPPNGRSNWRFSIQARNRQTGAVLAMADVAITVRDINDNKPLFEQKLYRTTLMENGAAGQVLTKLHAVDFDEADTADNGKIMYSLIKTELSNHSPKSWTTDLFQIDPHSGVLTVLDCCFDREKQSEYNLVARATDAGGLWDQTNIIVTIGDLNDNPPKFLNPSRTLRLDEWTTVDERQSQMDNSGQLSPLDENIFTFYISDADLPESNHHSYDILNTTHCPLFQQFHIVVNIDGSGTLYGRRRNATELRDELLSNTTTSSSITSCRLDVVVRDSVGDSQQTSNIGQVFEDHTTLTLLYDWTTAANSDHFNRSANHSISNHSSNPLMKNATSNANAVIAPDLDKETHLIDQHRSTSTNLQCSGLNCHEHSPVNIDHDHHHHSHSSNGSTWLMNGRWWPSSAFSAFKQWLNGGQSNPSSDPHLDDSFNNNTFVVYCSILLAINLFVLLSSGAYWIARRMFRSSVNNDVASTVVNSSTAADDYILSQTAAASSTTIANHSYYQLAMMAEPVTPLPPSSSSDNDRATDGTTSSTSNQLLISYHPLTNQPNTICDDETGVGGGAYLASTSYHPLSSLAPSQPNRTTTLSASSHATIIDHTMDKLMPSIGNIDQFIM